AVLCCRGRLARAGQMRPWRRLGPGLVERWRHADQDGVEPTVIVALELDHFGAAGIRAGQAQRGLDHLRASHAEAHQFGARHKLAHPSAELDLTGVLAGEYLAAGQAVGDRAADRLAGLTQAVW